MLSLPASVRVYLAIEPVDLRRGHDGLCALVRETYALDPHEGHLFAFVGRRGDRVKDGAPLVHVDDREQSYHWLDASPPGRTWKEAQLGDPKREARDAAWTPSADLPAPGVAGPPRAPGHLLP